MLTTYPNNMPAGKAVKVLPFEDEQSYQLNTGQRADYNSDDFFLRYRKTSGLTL